MTKRHLLGRKPLLIVLFIGFLLMSAISSTTAQTINGRVIDSRTSQGIPHAKISLEYYEISDSLFWYSDKNGEFEIDLDTMDWVDLFIEHYDYYGIDTSFLIDDGDVSIEFKMKSFHENGFSSISSSQVQLSQAFSFISPDMFTTEGKYKSMFGFELYSYNVNLFSESPVQLGFKLNPFKFEWLNFRDGISLVNTPTIKNRYFSFSGSLDIYSRFRLSSKNIIDVPFIDLGVGYELPYLVNYAFFTDENTKTTFKGIENKNNFRVMARLGYSFYAIKAEYKLTNTLKSTYFQEPKLTFGIEFLIPVG